MTIEITTRVVICISDNNRKVLPGRKTGLRAGMKKITKCFLLVPSRRHGRHRFRYRIESNPSPKRILKWFPASVFNPHPSSSRRRPSLTITPCPAQKQSMALSWGFIFPPFQQFPTTASWEKAKKEKQSAPSKALLGKSIAIRDEPKASQAASQPTQRNNIIKTHLDSNSC